MSEGKAILPTLSSSTVMGKSPNTICERGSATKIQILDHACLFNRYLFPKTVFTFRPQNFCLGASIGQLPASESLAVLGYGQTCRSSSNMKWVGGFNSRSQLEAIEPSSSGLLRIVASDTAGCCFKGLGGVPPLTFDSNFEQSQ